MEFSISSIFPDISATAFYKSQPIVDFVVEYLNIRDTSKRLSDQERIKVWTTTFMTNLFSYMLNYLLHA